MTDQQFTKIVSNMLGNIRSMTPWDTGNLASKATLSRSLGNGVIEISVDEGIADYFQFVNNYKMLRGKKNRNYHYFEKAFETAIKQLAADAGGEIVSD